MKEIQLTQGYVALVDDEDFERCMEGPKWYSQVHRRKNGSVRTVYAQRRVRREDGTRTSQYMHRFILGVTDPKVQVDHKDHNGLNNQKYNLRPATSAENAHNQCISTDSSSGCKGVHWSDQKWVARIMIDGKRRQLGRFVSIANAKKAYDSAALKYFGEFALTNEMMEAA